MAAPGTSTPALELADLGRRFGERPVLSGVTLQLDAGRTLAVLGRNGTGKSTLLRLLATLLRPHAGTVSVLGAALPRDGWKVRGRIGFLAHEPLLYRDLSGRENLLYHARLHRVAAPAARVEEALEQVGMRGRAEDPVRTLSQGMAQRIAVARVVLHRPALLLLDEPWANLDPAAVAMLEPLIGRASGCTRVITSHDPAGALAEADLALGLTEGAQAFVATPERIAAENLLGGLYR